MDSQEVLPFGLLNTRALRLAAVTCAARVGPLIRLLSQAQASGVYEDSLAELWLLACQRAPSQDSLQHLMDDIEICIESAAADGKRGNHAGSGFRVVADAINSVRTRSDSLVCRYARRAADGVLEVAAGLDWVLERHGYATAMRLEESERLFLRLLGERIAAAPEDVGAIRTLASSQQWPIEVLGTIERAEG